MKKIDARAFRAASQARRVASAYYLSNPRVTLIDVGWRIKESEGGRSTDELAVRVHVNQKPREAVLESLALTSPQLFIDKSKIPFDLVDIVESPYHLEWQWFLPQPPPRGNVFDPLQGGISISNEWFFNYGTLGGLVQDRETGDKMILSNWHVLVGSAYAPKGLKIYQPGRGDGGGIQGTIATYERDAMLQGVDAAVAKLNNVRQWVNDQVDLGPVSGVSAPALGMQVVKSGRGSNVTYGVIDGVEGEYPIRYGGLLRKIKYVQRIVPQNDGQQASVGGDSGSWWLEQSTNRAVALHFAGYDEPETALAIAMPQVLDALNIDIMTTVQADVTGAVVTPVELVRV